MELVYLALAHELQLVRDNVSSRPKQQNVGAQLDNKLGLIRDDEVRQQLLARAEARRNSLRGRVERWIMLALTAGACVSAVSTLLAKGVEAHAVGLLLLAPAFVMILLNHKPPKLLVLSAYVGVALFVWSFAHWLWTALIG